MKKSALILAPIWAISLGAAFLAGQSASEKSSRESGTLAATKSTSTTGSSDTLSGRGTTSTAASTRSARERLASAKMVKAGASNAEIIQDITRHGDPLERTNALLALIDTLAPDDFESVVAAFRELGITDERFGEYAMLLTAWAKVDPNSALAYAKENTGGRFARNTILETWATTNPDAALAWAKANHNDSEGANPWLVGVIRGMASNDLAGATDLMGTLPRSQERGEALQSLVSLMMTRNPEEAKNWSAGIEDDYLRSGAYAFTAEALSEKDNVAAAKWLSELGDVEAINRVGGLLAEDWYNESPEEATAWVSSLPAGAIGEGAEGIVEPMARENPLQAAQYLSDLAAQYPDENFDGSIRTLVRNSARRDPEVAAVWIAAMDDGRRKNRTYQWVLSEWNNRDKTAAQNWMRENEASLPVPIREQFLRNASTQ